jgi:hypothetical protein
VGVDIEVRWNGHNLGPALLKRARPVMAEGIGKGLNLSAEHWRNGVSKRFGKARIGPNLPGSIGNRSNALRLSLGFRVVPGAEGGLDGMRAVVFSAGVPYARAQQFGAVIKPVRAKRLALPGPANLTSAGVARKSNVRAWFEEFGASGQIALVPSKRTPGNTVVLWRPSNSSRRFAWDDGLVKRARVKAVKPAPWQHWWTFASSVTLPGPKSTGGPSRLGFYETWNAQRADRAKLIQHHVQQALNRAKLTAYVSADSVEIV